MGGIYLHSLSIPPFESDSSALFYTSASLLPSPLRYSELLLVSTSAVRQVRNMQKVCKTPGRRPRDFAHNFLSDGHNCLPYGNEPLFPSTSFPTLQRSESIGRKRTIMHNTAMRDARWTRLTRILLCEILTLARRRIKPLSGVDGRGGFLCSLAGTSRQQDWLLSRG